MSANSNSTWYITETTDGGLYKKKQDFYDRMTAATAAAVASPSMAVPIVPNFRIYKTDNKFWIYFGKKSPLQEWIPNVEDTYLLHRCKIAGARGYFNVDSIDDIKRQITDGMTIKLPILRNNTITLYITQNPSLSTYGKKGKKKKKKSKKKTKRQKETKKKTKRQNKSKSKKM